VLNKKLDMFCLWFFYLFKSIHSIIRKGKYFYMYNINLFNSYGQKHALEDSVQFYTREFFQRNLAYFIHMSVLKMV